MPASSPPMLARALSLGGKAAFSSWAAYLGAFLASMVASLAVSAMGGLFWLSLSGARGSTVALGAVGLGLLWFTAQLVRAISLGAGLLQAADRLRGGPVRPWLVSVGEGSSRALAWFLYGVLIELLREAWQVLAIGTTGYLYLRAFVFGRHGVGSAAALALAATVAIALWIAVRLWLDYGFARSLARGESFPVALFESAGVLWAEPWSPLAILVITAVLASVLELFVGFAPGRLVGPEGVHGQLLAGALIGAAVVGFVDIGALLLRLGAFSALELGRAGELPQPPAPLRAEPILEAELVVEARPLPPEQGPSQT